MFIIFLNDHYYYDLRKYFTFHFGKIMTDLYLVNAVEITKD